MASEPTTRVGDQTLLELLAEAATVFEKMVDGPSQAPEAFIASRLREAAGRLREEMARTCIASEDGCCSALKRVNGGPLVTSGADPGPKGEACKPWCGIPRLSAAKARETYGSFSYWLNKEADTCHCTEACRAAGRPLRPAASPATGMEPVPAGWPCAECGKNPKLENSAICGSCLERLLHEPTPPPEKK